MLKQIDDDKARLDRMCELNVARQVINLSNTTVIQEAWRREQALTVHGWIYGIGDGWLSDLGIEIKNNAQLRELEAQEYDGTGA